MKVLNEWIPYDHKDVNTYPKEYGKYFVTRKDGKVHWETWNGIGWAYNHTVIIAYAEILPFKKK